MADKKAPSPRLLHVQQPAAYHGEPGPLIATDPVSKSDPPEFVPPSIGDHSGQALRVVSLKKELTAVGRLLALPRRRLRAAGAEVVLPGRQVAIMGVGSGGGGGGSGRLTNPPGIPMSGHSPRSRPVCDLVPARLCVDQ